MTFAAVLLAVAAMSVGVWMGLQPPDALEIPPQGVVIADATVVNPGRGRTPQQTIRVEGDRIAAIAQTRSADASEARFRGRFVLPGLIDMHVHHPPGFDTALTELFGLLFLAHGVTTVRDTANFDGTIMALRARILAGERAGPRIFACGNLLDGEPPFWPLSLVIQTADDAREAVAELAADGVHCIKAYGGLQPDALAAIRSEAEAHGLPLIGHVPMAVRFEAAGLADAQHLIGVPDVPPAEDPTQWREFFGEIVLKAWNALDPARIDFIVHTSLEQGIAHTPTLVVWDHVSQLDRYEAQRESATARMMPRYITDVFWNPAGDARFGEVKPEVFEQQRRMVERQKQVVAALHVGGVRVYAGSDTLNPFVVPGASLHEELRLFFDAGLTPEEAWVTATRSPGEFLPESDLGVIRPGAPADLLVFREDPTLDLAALSTLEAVVAQGRVYTSEDLDRAIGAHREHMTGWVYDGVSMTLARWLLGGASDTSDE